MGAPTVVLELLQQPVHAIAAGHATSAALLQSGDALTWGSGADGKLGLGDGRDAAAPARVEAFVGRVPGIAAVALGGHHSLWLDAAGACWAAGANSEGQLGCGTSFAEVASQQRAAWFAGRQIGQLGVAQSSAAAQVMQQLHAAAAAEAAAAADGQHTAAGWGSLGGWGRQGGGSDWAYAAGGGGGRSGRRSWLAGPGAPRRGGDGGRGGGGGWPPTSAHGGISSSGMWHVARDDLAAHLAALHMAPGPHAHVPVRVGCRHSPDSLLGGAADAASGADGGLANERVVSVAAGRHLSVAATAGGEVYTFGSCFSGGLGSEEASWCAAVDVGAAGCAASLRRVLSCCRCPCSPNTTGRARRAACRTRSQRRSRRAAARRPWRPARASPRR